MSAATKERTTSTAAVAVPKTRIRAIEHSPLRSLQPRPRRSPRSASRKVARLRRTRVCRSCLPGQYRDDETGLSYNWHRYYDGGLGRFLATDSANQFGGALSSYTYAAGWVPNAYDPDGRFVFLAPGAVAVAPYVIGGVAALALFLKPDRVPQPGPTAGPPKKPSPGPDPAPDPAPDPDPSPGPKRIPTPDNRQFCIDMYVLCQNQGWTGSCFACMETCTGSDGNWPFAQCHPRKNACE